MKKYLFGFNFILFGIGLIYIIYLLKKSIFITDNLDCCPPRFLILIYLVCFILIMKKQIEWINKIELVNNREIIALFFASIFALIFAYFMFIEINEFWISDMCK
jgi:hypothetical protein